MAKITRLHHVGIYVFEMSRALRFYGEALKLPTVFERPGLTLLDAGNGYVELIEPGPESPLRQRTANEWEGPNHIAFETPDLAGLLGELAERGLALRDESPRALPNYLFAFLASEVFDGVSVELVQVTMPFAYAAQTEVLGYDRVVVSFPDIDVAGANLEAWFGLEPLPPPDYDTGRYISVMGAGDCRLELVEQITSRTGLAWAASCSPYATCCRCSPACEGWRCR
jgi:catechol 2,3-dioxygenase-like lactoylglutathione lyase family enzyme